MRFGLLGTSLHSDVFFPLLVDEGNMQVEGGTQLCDMVWHCAIFVQIQQIQQI
jgi:hypothetical protein